MKKHLFSIFICIFIFTFNIAAQSSIRYVSNIGIDSTICGGINNPYHTIQYAINQSNLNDTIILLPGIYYQPITINSTKNLTISSMFILTHDTSLISNTIMDGSQYYGPDAFINLGLCQSDTDRIIGLTIRNSLIQCLAINHGGKALISNSVFYGNGMVAESTIWNDGYSTFDNSYFYSNYGSAVFYSSVSGIMNLFKCKFKNNIPNGNVILYQGSGKISRCYFENNNAPCISGWSLGSSLALVINIENNTLINNNVGVFFSGGMTWNLKNNVIENNQININFLNMSVQTYAVINFKRNFIKPYQTIVSPSIYYYNIQHIETDSTGQSGLDSISAEGYYSLSSSSKLIGAGTNLVNSPIDFLGNPAPIPLGSNYDLGAIESSLDLPIIKADSIPSFCVNDNPSTLEFANPKGGVYSGPGITNGTTFSPSTLGAGQYSIRYTFTNANTQVVQDSFNITVKPIPVNIIVSDTIASCDDSLFISASSGLNSYLWSNGKTTSEIFAKTTGLYIITAFNNLGCSNKDSVVVLMNKHNVDAGINITKNCGDSLILNPSTNYSKSPNNLSWNWSPNIGLNSVSSKNPVAKPLVTTTYFLTLNSTEGCTATDSIKITVNPLTVDAGLNASIVCGDSLQLNANPNFSNSAFLYSWVPSNGLNKMNVKNPKTAPSASTNYKVTLSSSNGCGNPSDSIFISVNPLIVEAGANKTIICGGTAQLNSVQTNYSGNGILKYYWSPSIGLNNDSIINPTATITQTTKYYVTVIAPNGCSGSDSITVTVNPFIADAGNNKTIVCGSSVVINNITTNYSGTGALTYLWSPNSGLNNVNIQNPTSSTNNTITYHLTVTTPNGCIANDSVKVNVTPLTAEAGSDKTIICGGNTQLNSVITNYNGGGTLQYNWTPSLGLNNDTITNPTATITQSTKYYVTVTTPNGCTTMDSITVNVNPFIVDAGLNKTIVCGASSQLNTVSSNFSGTGTLSYLWSPTSGLNNFTISNPVANVIQTTKYFVTVTTPNGCVSTDSISVIVNPFTAEAGSDKTIICGGTVQLNNVSTNFTGTGSLTYAWTPTSGLNSFTIPNPTSEVTQNTEYFVTVTTPNGCIANDSINVNVNPLIAEAGLNKTIICGGTAQLNNVSTNYTGTGTLAYAWSPTTGLNSISIINPTSYVSQNINYYVTVTTPNGCQATDSINVIVNPLTVNAGTDKINICGDTTQIDSLITNYTGNGILTYSWNPAIGLNSTTIPKPYSTATGITYTVTANTPNGCIANDIVSINSLPMSNPDICIVGVDTNNKNMVIWNKPYSTAIDSFLIYRETNVTGIYTKIGSVAYDSASLFIDNTSNPNIQSDKYKISVLDSCNIESAKSAYHKTMHLTINQGVGSTWNLIWDPYEGFTVSTYKIYRGTIQNNLQLIGSTSGGNTQYSDFSAPSGYIYYQIEVISPNICNNTKSINSTRSNIATNNPNYIVDYSDSQKINVYPNPFNNELIIETKGNKENLDFEILNSLGQVIYNGNVKEKSIIQTNGFACGVYLIKIKNGKNYVFKKIIKE